MAKASALSADLVDTTPTPLPARQLATEKPAKREAPANDALVQIRCTQAQRRAIKSAAVAADLNISELMLSLFQKYQQQSIKA